MRVLGCRSPHRLLLVLLFATAAVAPLRAHADAVDDYVRAEMTKRRIPGLALAVARNGAVVKLQGYGFANLEHEVAATPDTVFELASVTKQFTATAILLLAEEGKLQLDDPITWHILRAPETWKSITVRHLLTHTGGFPSLREGFNTLRQQGWLANYPTQQLFDSATKDKLVGAPSERWEYSDVGYFLLGMIIESASSQRYGTFLAERFWKPLGMTSTSLLDHWRILKHRAAGYTIRDGELINIRRISQVELPSHYGVFSTVKDLVIWDAALAAGRVLKPASLTQLWTPARLASGALVPYALGWGLEDRRGHRVISHTGITGTEYSRYPDDSLTVIVLTNLGRSVGPGTEAANAWGLTHGVAGRYAPDLLLNALTPQTDPDPAATQRIADMIAAIARGEETAMLLPALRAAIIPGARQIFADRLRTQQSFTYLTCDKLPAGTIGRRGDAVDRRCYCKAVNATESRYYTFWLTSDGRVADLSSTLD
jgi:CubicO group peptidase (beta-lactamase class C family)